MSRIGLFVVTALAATFAAGCTVQETDAPPLAGPSEFALSINMQVSPDSIPQDGATQSSITIEARDPNSQPVRGLSLRVEMYVDGVGADFGTLSSRTVVTGDDGRAHFTYTPPAAPIESVGPGHLITFAVTPVGSDYRSAQARTVDLRLFPPGVIQPPAGDIVPAFIFSPTTVTTFQRVTFDASATTEGGIVCGGACTYIWSFGDGGSGQGLTATHEFRAPGSYVVTLRVVGTRRQERSTTQTVTVGASTEPTAAFEFSPAAPLPSQDIFFTAEASRAAPGRRIVRYDWNFGSGRTGSGVTVSKRYDTIGEYVVTLTVTDDANQKGTISKTVPVGVVEEEEGTFVGRHPGKP